MGGEQVYMILIDLLSESEIDCLINFVLSQYLKFRQGNQLFGQ